MPSPVLEIADIFRDYGAAWREANRGHVSLGQLKVMSAIQNCRTAARRAGGALSARRGHVARCENDACAHTLIAYNSCLMGKIGNGELAREGVPISLILKRFSADLGSFLSP